MTASRTHSIRVDVLTRLMKRAGLTREKLAETAPVSINTLRSLLDGEPAVMATIKKIAKVFNVTPDELILPAEPVKTAIDPEVMTVADPQASRQGLGIAIEHFRAGRFQEAHVELLRLCDSENSPAAQNHLGWMYQHGLGVPLYYQQAVEWYRRAAIQGDHNGQSNLGWMYEHGLGVPCDYAQALHWHTLAARQGNGLSMNQLGWMHQNGHGVPVNYAEAARWYQQSADSGNREGLNNFGWMCEHGLGVPQNPTLALQYYRRSVEMGNPNAHDNLARVVKAVSASASP